MKLDENVPEAAFSKLAADGHDVESAASEGLLGARDDQIREAAADELRIIVSLDLDFADLRFLDPSSPGAVVLRPKTLDIASVLELVDELRAALAQRSVGSDLWIVEPGRIRVRSP